MVLGLRGHRGVGMVRKWKWYPPTDFEALVAIFKVMAGDRQILLLAGN